MFWEIPSTYLLKYVGKYEYFTYIIDSKTK